MSAVLFPKLTTYFYSNVPSHHGNNSGGEQCRKMRILYVLINPVPHCLWIERGIFIVSAIFCYSAAFFSCLSSVGVVGVGVNVSMYYVDSHCPKLLFYASQ